MGQEGYDLFTNSTNLEYRLHFKGLLPIIWSKKHSDCSRLKFTQHFQVSTPR